MTPTLIRFPSETLDKIDLLVGNKQRAQFIRTAVEAEIERRRESIANGAHSAGTDANSEE